MWIPYTLLACAGEGLQTGETGAPDAASEVGSANVELPRAELQLRLPVAEPADVMSPGSENPGFDHDPEGGACLDYAGFTNPWCFDAHTGTDFTLLGSFHAMNANRGAVVAAAEGVVRKVVDGNYDRCHSGPKGLDCDGYPIQSNIVIVDHPTGHSTEYWHLAAGIAVKVGQNVWPGDHLGYMGASASPEVNLHFELKDADGVRVDPFGGPHSQPETYWCDQGEHGELPGTDCLGG